MPLAACIAAASTPSPVRLPQAEYLQVWETRCSSSGNALVSESASTTVACLSAIRASVAKHSTSDVFAVAESIPREVIRLAEGLLLTVAVHSIMPRSGKASAPLSS